MVGLFSLCIMGENDVYGGTRSTFSLAVKDVELKSLSLVVHRFKSCNVQ